MFVFKPLEKNHHVVVFNGTHTHTYVYIRIWVQGSGGCCCILQIYQWDTSTKVTYLPCLPELLLNTIIIVTIYNSNDDIYVAAWSEKCRKTDSLI